MSEGILCIDKPEGWTSFDVVAKVRGLTRCRKIGHGGTLDPIATGVLPLFFCRAAKAVSLVPDSDKEYIAGFRLGISTDTLDITGVTLSESPLAVAPETLQKALCAFRGEITQLPPMYSAVKVNGQRLYDIARSGGQTERAPRPATVRELELLSYDPFRREGSLRILCSKGTYVRAITDDLGRALGCGGVMTSLRRTKALGFSLSDCVTLPRLESLCSEGGAPEFLPVDSVFSSYERVELTEKQEKLFCSGVRLDCRRIDRPDTQAPQRVYGPEGRFLGLARAGESHDYIIIKLFGGSQTDTERIHEDILDT